jgi:hypothetical protein
MLIPLGENEPAICVQPETPHSGPSAAKMALKSNMDANMYSARSRPTAFKMRSIFKKVAKRLGAVILPEKQPACFWRAGRLRYLSSKRELPSGDKLRAHLSGKNGGALGKAWRMGQCMALRQILRGAQNSRRVRLEETLWDAACARKS